MTTENTFNLPDKPDDLIDLLDKAFPLRNFPVSAGAAEMHRHMGARDVVDFLRRLQQDRDERIAEQFGTSFPTDE